VIESINRCDWRWADANPAKPTHQVKHSPTPPHRDSHRCRARSVLGVRFQNNQMPDAQPPRPGPPPAAAVSPCPLIAETILGAPSRLPAGPAISLIAKTRRPRSGCSGE